MFLQASENFFGIVCGNVFTRIIIVQFRAVSQEDFVFSVYINKNVRYFLAIFHKKLQKNKYSHTGVWSF